MERIVRRQGQGEAQVFLASGPQKFPRLLRIIGVYLSELIVVKAGHGRAEGAVQKNPLAPGRPAPVVSEQPTKPNVEGPA